MADQTRPYDEIVRTLGEDGAEAVTDGILGGGHYDSEPAPEDLERRTPIGAS